MKICFVFIFLFFCGLSNCVFCSSPNTVELNVVDNEIEFSNFVIGNYFVNGKFKFDFQKEGSSPTLYLEGSNITFNDKHVSWLKARLSKRGDMLFIDHLTTPQYSIRGNIDLEKRDLSLNLEGRWQEDSEFLEGLVFVKAKVWGSYDNYLLSGHLTVDEGVFEGQAFKKLRLDFLGKQPILNITDSKITLADGSIFAFEQGKVLDIRDFSNPIIPDAEFVSHKVYFGDWQIFSEDTTNVGLKKNIGERIDVFLNTSKSAQDDREDLDTGTEIRYNWKDDQFLRLRMEPNKTFLGFERRKDF